MLSKILMNLGVIVGLVAAGTLGNWLLAPPAVKVFLPVTTLPAPGVTVTPKPVFPAPVTVTAAGEMPAPPETSGCEPKWKRALRSVASAFGISSAFAQPVCCPCFGGVTVDSGNISKNLATAKSLVDLIAVAKTGVSVVTALSSAAGAKGGGQFGTTAMPLAVPAPNLAGVTGISAPNSAVSSPTLTDATSAGAWVNATFSTSATDAATVQAVQQRRAAAAIEAVRYGYGLAAQQRSDQSLAAENAAFITLGNVPTTAVGQAAGLGNAAASLAADAQHLEAMEEASLEITASAALRTAGVSK
jgi:hypothetical protein